MVVKDGWRDDDNGRLGSGTVAQTLTKSEDQELAPSRHAREDAGPGTGVEREKRVG